MELIQNKETGIVEAWEDGKKIGEIRGMGDDMGMALEKQLRPQSNPIGLPEEKAQAMPKIKTPFIL